MLLVALVILIVLAVAVRLAGPPIRRRWMVVELRGDWWTGFEREFRAYASRSWEAAREAERGR